MPRSWGFGAKGMSQYFYRCPHCNFPHGEGTTTCPNTGLTVELKIPPSIRPATADFEDIEIEAWVPFNISPPSIRPPQSDLSALAQTVSPHGPPRAASLLGTVIGNAYLIQSMIGGGGMGTVYAGQEIHNGRAVAVKVLPADQADNVEASKRFLREARLIATLSHPNICPIYHYGTLADGRPYYAMELLEGQPLSRRMSRHGPLPFVEAIEIMSEVLSALRTAHGQHIIHRDIKPENIFLHRRCDNHTMVKLLDFGISKRVQSEMAGEDTTQLTHTGFVMGTPYYLAPEQALGSRTFDQRVDIWATGVVLYEAMSGKKPFTGPSYPAILAKIVSEEVPRLSELRPDAPSFLQAILDKALAKNATDRFESAAAFRSALLEARMRLLINAQRG